jgi:flagellar biosynthesis protein FliR
VTFLSATTLPLIFALDAHHWLLTGLIGSYGRLVPGAAVPLGDLVEVATRLSGAALTTGVQIAAPLIVLSLLTNLTFGLLNRMMPTLQALMIAIPAQVLIALSALAIGLASALAIAMRFVERSTLWLG